MNNRGLTLMELIVVMVIAGIIFLAVTCQFVSELTFRIMINNQIAATNDASTAMCHMTRILRYAKPLADNWATPAVGYITSITATIDKAVAGGSLPEFTGDTVVIYRRKNDNTLEYKKGADAAYVISDHITAFPVTWVNPNLTIQLTAQRGSRSSSLNTKIRVLGL